MSSTKFDVVLVLLPNVGKASAAGTAANLRSSYPNLSIVMLTGICGGVPNPGSEQEILLGDVIVSKSVVQYDLSDSVCEGSRSLACDSRGCNGAFVVWRQRLEDKLDLERLGRVEAAQTPSVFVGRVGSGDTVLKSGEDRDRISREHGLIALEMKGAGILDELPCIITKGVSDYADSHKNKEWQHFAAAGAAAVTRGLIERYIKRDTLPKSQVDQFAIPLEDEETKRYLRDLWHGDPREDMTCNEDQKGDLLRDAYKWILEDPDFQQWQNDPQSMAVDAQDEYQKWLAALAWFLVRDSWNTKRRVMKSKREQAVC
ncbi:zinc finger protein [Trichoderma arundinaceum]|uniref:Zinc finger protein n=1 Tax=Trichoderma arundinaceum TaxID=490622 RepID=A0A395NE95_TRIAR|nr:zinc finger protein [Trichoderma arundinaceum]